MNYLLVCMHFLNIYRYFLNCVFILCYSRCFLSFKLLLYLCRFIFSFIYGSNTWLIDSFICIYIYIYICIYAYIYINTNQKIRWCQQEVFWWQIKVLLGKTTTAGFLLRVFSLLSRESAMCGMDWGRVHVLIIDCLGKPFLGWFVEMNHVFGIGLDPTFVFLNSLTMTKLCIALVTIIRYFSYEISTSKQHR